MSEIEWKEFWRGFRQGLVMIGPFAIVCLAGLVAIAWILAS